MQTNTSDHLDRYDMDAYYPLQGAWEYIPVWRSRDDGRILANLLYFINNLGIRWTYI
jgi:hypothetical protein